LYKGDLSSEKMDSFFNFFLQLTGKSSEIFPDRTISLTLSLPGKTVYGM